MARFRRRASVTSKKRAEEGGQQSWLKKKDPEQQEQDWITGNRAAWVSMLAECLRHLDVTDSEAGKVRWVYERENTIAALRRLCDEFGDNDWLEELWLPDIIEKHLVPYLMK